MCKEKKIVVIGLLMLCLIPLRSDGRMTSLGSDTLSYKQAIDGILRLDADLKACEANLEYEKAKSEAYKQQLESSEKATKVVKRKVFWGKVWLGLKAGAVGIGIGVIIMSI